MTTTIDELFLKYNITPCDVDLEHHGVKGMKWGIRKEDSGGSSRADAKAAKSAAKADKKWEKNANTLSTYIQLNNAAAARVNRDLVGLNAKMANGRDFNNDSPERRKYYKAVEDMVNKHYRDVAVEFGMNPSQTRRIEYKMTIDHVTGDDRVTMNVVDVKHAEFSPPTLTLVIKSGVIQEIEFGKPEMAHELDDFLAHHGIKGMKWGIRRERGSDGTVGGNPANAKDPRTLSDADLRAAVNRMQLERQFTQLQSERVQKGDNFAKSYLKAAGKRQVSRVADKALDVGVELAIKAVASKSGNKHVEEVARRLKPKKK